MSFVAEHFEWLDEIARCIAEQFGENCEVVVHDLTLPYEQTIVAIYNGHVTGRRLGEGGTLAGLEILRGSRSPQDQYGYLNETKDGRMLKTSSKYFKDETGQVVGSLCINYDITGFLQGEKALGALLGSKEKKSNEEFPKNVEELLDDLLREAVSVIGKRAIPEGGRPFRRVATGLSKEEKIAVVQYLDRKGAFLIKKAAEQVAECLSVSRFTVYNYLNAGKEGQDAANMDTKRKDL